MHSFIHNRGFAVAQNELLHFHIFLPNPFLPIYASPCLFPPVRPSLCGSLPRHFLRTATIFLGKWTWMEGKKVRVGPHFEVRISDIIHTLITPCSLSALTLPLLRPESCPVVAALQVVAELNHLWLLGFIGQINCGFYLFLFKQQLHLSISGFVWGQALTDSQKIKVYKHIENSKYLCVLMPFATPFLQNVSGETV